MQEYYHKRILTKKEIFMSLLNKLDPTQIFQLASTIIDARKDLEILKVKSSAFLEILKLHDEKSKVVLTESTKQFAIVIDALKTSIEALSDPEDKLQAIRYLVEYGNLSMKTLGETSQSVLEKSPNIPYLKE